MAKYISNSSSHFTNVAAIIVRAIDLRDNLKYVCADHHRRNAIAIKDPHFKTEDVFLSENRLAPLPEDVNIDVLKKSVSKILPFSSPWSKAIWRKLFVKSCYTTNICADFFWWGSSHLFYAQDSSMDLEPLVYYLKRRVSDTYVKVLRCLHTQNINRHSTDEYLDNFSDAISRVVYKALLIVYNEYRPKIRSSTFTSALISTICSWTTGNTPKSTTWKNWRIDRKNCPKVGRCRKKQADACVDPNYLYEISDEDKIASDELSSDEDELNSTSGVQNYDGNGEDFSSLPSLNEPWTKRKYLLEYSPSVNEFVRKNRYASGYKFGVSIKLSERSQTHLKNFKSFCKADCIVNRKCNNQAINRYQLDKLYKKLNDPEVQEDKCTDKGIDPKVKLIPCEFEIPNPIAESKERRREKATAEKKKENYRTRDFDEIVAKSSRIAIFEQKLNSTVHGSRNKTKIDKVTLRPIGRRRVVQYRAN